VVPGDVEELFEKCLAATVHVYRSLGVPAEYKPINDVVVRGKKISGNGAGRLGKAVILVGNVILDWDFDSLVRVLKVPDEKFRDKMAKSMREWLTSLKQELGYVPPLERIKELIAEGFERALGIRLVRGEPTPEEIRVYEEVVLPKHKSREWLYLPEERHPWVQPGRVVKIADGVRVVSVAHKARKMIRLTAELLGDKILDVIIAGDFFAVPSEAIKELEEALRGCRLVEEELKGKIEAFYARTGVKTPGMKPEDLLDALLKLREAVKAYLPSVRPSAEEE
ncbi:lipoate--protein ligase family protein, partial [Candidatus Bathyarchaeota archaeon]